MMKSLTRGTLKNAAASISVGSRPRILSPFGNRPHMEQQLRSMGSVGTLFAIVNRLANATSQVDWHLYRKPAQNGPAASREEREEVFNHIALDLWNKPNPFFTRQEFVEACQQHVDLTGEGYWWVSKNILGWPDGLWCVRPDKMTPVPHPTEYLAGYIYKGPNGEKVPLEVDEVVQLRMPNPLDYYRGMGPVQSILVDLDSTRYSAEWNRNFFVNSAVPGGVIEVPENLSDETFDRIRMQFDEMHRGVTNAHRIAILEHGQYKDVGYSMKDMQFAELRDVSREVIREAFSFPKAMLGTVDDVNRANAEANELVFARWVIKPRLERIKLALNNDLLPLFPQGELYEFDYDLPVPEDQEAANNELTARSGAAVALVGAGWNADDALKVVGLPEMRFVGQGATE